MTSNRFRTIRLWLNMTQDDYAEFLNLSPSTVYMIESGNRKVTDRIRAKIAAKVELTDDFFDFERKMQIIS